MTDKEKIREEVVGIINSINLFAPDEDGKNSSYEEGRLDAASKILQIIDSLEEPVSEELKEAAWLYYDKNRLPIPPDWDLHKEFIDSFKAGAKWHKDKIMQNTIDARCFGFQGAALFSFRLPADNYLVGSEVKVIVVKED